jgi:hypothetical protein
MNSRPRFGSRPDRDVHAPDVYEILGEHDRRLGGLEGLAQEGKLADAQILTKLGNIEATDRHATTKLIGGFVITIVTTLAGVIGTIVATRPNPVQAPVVVQRSELDKKMDKCRAMPPVSRGECFVQVASEFGQ